MSNYGTNVSFSVPVYQRPAIRTQEKPEINVETIDVSKFVKGFAEGIEKRQAAEQEQQMEALRTAYANERDQIQIALEQGEINETDADIVSRKLSASYRARGLTVEDDMKIKKGYGEALAGLAKTRQEMIVKEQEQVRQDRRKEIRDMFPSLKDADNNTIDSLDNYSKMFGKTQEQLHAIIDNPYTSQSEREGAMRQLTNSIENEAFLNTQAIALNYMEQVETTGQVNTDFKQKFLEDTTQQLVSKGFPPATARLTSENLWKTTGLADYHNLSTIDREAATKEFQSRTANYEAALKTSGMEQIYAKIKERPQMAAILALPEQSQRVLPQYMWEDFNNNFVTYRGKIVGDQVEQKKLEFTGPESLVGAIQYHNIVLKSQTTSNANKNYTTGTVLAGANSFLDKTDIKTASKQDLATVSKNATELRTRLDTPAVRKEIEEGLRSKNPEAVAAARQAQEYLDILGDKETAIKFMYNVEGPAKELLADNANRMRYDIMGNVVLVGERSWWQAVTDQFTDLEHTVESINNGASMLTADKRQRMFQQLGVKPLQAGETAADLSGLNVAKAATGVIQAVEKHFNDDPITIQAAEQTVTKLLPGLTGEDRKQAIEEVLEAISPKDFGNAIHQQNMSKEDYQTWYKQKVAKNLNQIVNKYTDPFTGEETTTTGKVSNKSTIGGTSIVPDSDRDYTKSIKALREQAAKLQASIDSIEASGFKTEEGKLERDRLEIEKALKLANKLEAEMQQQASPDSDAGSPGLSLEADSKLRELYKDITGEMRYLRKKNKDNTPRYHELQQQSIKINKLFYSVYGDDYELDEGY